VLQQGRGRGLVHDLVCGARVHLSPCTRRLAAAAVSLVKAPPATAGCAAAGPSRIANGTLASLSAFAFSERIEGARDFLY